MFKKVITTAVLGVSALSMMAANAAAPGPYITGQLGYADTHMSGRTEFGDKINGLSITEQSSNNLSNNGLAGRLAVGYQFNQNLAVELGYLQLRSKKTDLILQKDEDTSITAAAAKLSQNAIDLAAKGILPLASNLNAYGKLGVAYVSTTGKVNVAGKDSVSGTERKWAPEAAVGVSYDITPNMSLDTSWTHIQAVGNKSNLGNIDFVAVGVGYNFG